MDFKQNPKMKSQIACFKEGGQVYKSRTHKEDPKELKEDKAIAKKAVSQHEAAKHKGEAKTELKLKGGRRVPKAKGTVNKFKKGGAVDTAEKGKPSAGKDPIKKVKEAPKKAATPSKAKTKKPEVPGTETGPSGNLSAMTAPPAEGPMAAAPSAATMMPEMEGMQNMAAGKRVRPQFFNEEPDDMTAVPTRPRKAPIPKKVRPMVAPLGAASDIETSMMGPQDYGMSGGVSDEEREMIMNMFQGGPQGYSDGRSVDGRRYTYGEINGMPVTEEQMRAIEAQMAARPKSQSEIELDEFANRARSKMTPQAPGKPMKGFAYGGMVPGAAGLGNAMDTGPLGSAAPMGSPRNVPMSPQEMDIMRGLQAVGNYCKGGKAY